jgi:hypothetical protein
VADARYIIPLSRAEPGVVGPGQRLVRTPGPSPCASAARSAERQPRPSCLGSPGRLLGPGGWVIPWLRWGMALGGGGPTAPAAEAPPVPQQCRRLPPWGRSATSTSSRTRMARRCRRMVIASSGATGPTSLDDRLDTTSPVGPVTSVVDLSYLAVSSSAEALSPAFARSPPPTALNSPPLNGFTARSPSELDVHVILENLPTHKTPKVQKWLLHHPRFHRASID